MKIKYVELVRESGIVQELEAALIAIVANRAVAPPQILKDFTGYNPGPPAPSNTVQNTAMLAIMARLIIQNKTVGGI
jgi:hypothetical protein